MCSNGRYTERASSTPTGSWPSGGGSNPTTRSRVDKHLGHLGVLLEPATVVAKAWEQIAAIGRRTFWDPNTVLVIGAGPIGLLAALIGVQQGGDVYVLDRVTAGPKPALVKQLGATYHTGAIADLGLQPDIIVDCTGVTELIQQALQAISPGGIICLTGVGSPTAPRTDPRPPWRPTSCSRTSRRSAPSTPTAGTTTAPPRYSPPPTGPGSSSW